MVLTQQGEWHQVITVTALTDSTDMYCAKPKICTHTRASLRVAPHRGIMHQLFGVVPYTT